MESELIASGLTFLAGGATVLVVKIVRAVVGRFQLSKSIDEAVERAVFNVQNSFVKSIKESSEDGKLTQAEAWAALNAAKGQVFAELASAATSTWGALKIFLVDETEIERRINDKVEEMKGANSR